ncbi:MAG: hypothetical protein ACK47B_16175 [Armatimonadota bacterium]
MGIRETLERVAEAVTRHEHGEVGDGEREADAGAREIDPTAGTARFGVLPLSSPPVDPSLEESRETVLPASENPQGMDRDADGFPRSEGG